MRVPFSVRAAGGRLRAIVAAVVAVTLLVPFAAAEAAPTTVDSTVTMSGTSPFQALVNPILFHCDTCLPDLFISNADESTVGVAVDVSTRVRWVADASIATGYESENVRQGTTVDVTNDATGTGGTIEISYQVHYIAGIFACGDDFPACDGNNDFGKWEITGDTASDTIVRSTSGACSLNQSTCDISTSLNLINLEFLGVGVGADLVIEHEFDIGDDGIAAHRIVGFTGSAVADADLNFATPLPSSAADDSFAIPCATPVGSSVNYRLTQLAMSPDVTATGSLGLRLFVDGPGPLDGDTTFGLVDGEVFDGNVAMTGSPEPNVFLGSVLPDNVDPTISNITISPNPGSEGSAMSFGATATDNCGTPEIHWTFSDGGNEFGANVQHTFADNGTFSAHVVATDSQGNSVSQDFLVDVGNVAPTVSAGPDKQSDWGIPVSFHANGNDAGSADKGGLLYDWDFDDPANPVGASGQDASHVFSQPGTYDVVVTVTDKDGASSSDTVVVTVTRRTTTLTYTGQLQSGPNKQVVLSASLTDEYGQPAPASLISFTLGTQSGMSANTNGSGVATTQVRLNQQPGAIQASADFAGNALYLPSGPDTVGFVIGNGGGGGGGNGNGNGNGNNAASSSTAAAAVTESTAPATTVAAAPAEAPDTTAAPTTEAPVTTTAADAGAASGTEGS